MVKKIDWTNMGILQKLWYLVLISFVFHSCNPSRKIEKSELDDGFKKSLERFVTCLNTRDKYCLLELYDNKYRSLSPLHGQESVADFIESNLKNLDKNNFEIVINIKEIEINGSMAYASMNWQLKTKGASKEDDPFANVQRFDVWKKDSLGNWRIFRTIIYDERSF